MLPAADLPVRVQHGSFRRQDGCVHVHDQCFRRLTYRSVLNTDAFVVNTDAFLFTTEASVLKAEASGAVPEIVWKGVYVEAPLSCIEPSALYIEALPPSSM